MSLIETLSANLGLSDAQLAILAANADVWRQAEIKKLADDISRAEQGTKLTRNGFELMGKAVAGQELRFTRVKLGDAGGQYPDDDAQFEMNDLINPLFEAAITEVKHTGGGTCAVTARVQNATLEESFRLVEIGLFAIDPDTDEVKQLANKKIALAELWRGLFFMSEFVCKPIIFSPFRIMQSYGRMRLFSIKPSLPDSQVNR